MLLEIDRRHAERADGRWREINHDHPKFVELAAVFRVYVGRRGIEGDANIIVEHMGQQPVDALGRGFHAQFTGAFKALGLGVDADHPDRLDPFRSIHFHQQVSADIARADNGRSEFLAHPVKPHRSGAEGHLGTAQAIDSQRKNGRPHAQVPAAPKSRRE